MPLTQNSPMEKCKFQHSVCFSYKQEHKERGDMTWKHLIFQQRKSQRKAPDG